MAEERISEPKVRGIEIIQYEEQINNIMKKNKTISYPWDNFKHSNRAVTEIPKRQEKIKFKLWPNISQTF